MEHRFNYKDRTHQNIIRNTRNLNKYYKGNLRSLKSQNLLDSPSNPLDMNKFHQPEQLTHPCIKCNYLHLNHILSNQENILSTDLKINNILLCKRHKQFHYQYLYRIICTQREYFHIFCIMNYIKIGLIKLNTSKFQNQKSQNLTYMSSTELQKCRMRRQVDKRDNLLQKHRILKDKKDML